MNMKENNFNNLPNMGKDGQFNLQFKDTATENHHGEIEGEYLKEQTEVALKFHIAHSEELEKGKDGRWYLHGLDVEGLDHLYEDTNDNNELYNNIKRPLPKKVTKRPSPVNKRPPLFPPFNPYK